MEKIDFTFLDLEQLKRLDVCSISHKKYGVNAKIYAYQENAIKIINEGNQDKNKILEKAKLFAQTEELKRSNVVLPEKIVVIDGIERGYTTRIVKGYNLFQLMTMDKIPNITYSDFIKAYENALQDIDTITQQSIVMQDSGFGNIMYDLDEKKFKFVDIDDWYFTNEGQDDFEKLQFNIVQFQKKIEMSELTEEKFRK